MHSHNFRILKAEPFSFNVTYLQTVDDELVPVDLTGLPVTFILFVSDPTEPVLTLSRGSGISVVDAEGKIIVNLTSSQTNRSESSLRYRLRVQEPSILTGSVKVNV